MKEDNDTALVSRLLIWCVVGYQKLFSLDHGLLGKIIPHRVAVCAFSPSCSQYTILAIKKYGPIHGIYKGVVRVLRCHPWQKPQVDFP